MDPTVIAIFIVGIIFVIIGIFVLFFSISRKDKNTGSSDIFGIVIGSIVLIVGIIAIIAAIYFQIS